MAKTIQERARYIAHFAKCTPEDAEKKLLQEVENTLECTSASLQTYALIRSYWPWCESLYEHGNAGKLKKHWRFIAAEQIIIAKTLGEI